jgi:PAS domain S-box-containing protein
VDKVTISTVPSTDRAFRVHVDAAVARIPNITADRLAAEIRLAYPEARVHEASPLGTIGDLRPRWYVYRDRQARRTAESDWWRDETLPRTVLDASGRYVDANEAASDLFGVPREGIIGAKSGSFTRHEADEALARRLFDELARTGELSSTAVVIRPDGSQIPIDFHTSRITQGSITVMRPAGTSSSESG